MFPTPYTIQTLAYIEGAEDAHGNPVDSWGEPVDVPVYGWAKPQSDEPKLVGRDSVVVDIEVYAPPSASVGTRDKAIVDGLTYTVEGEAEDYNHGPFSWQPGVVINCKRAEG